MIDIRADLLKIIKDILAQVVPECEVRAFGSRVNWTARDASDLDLVVDGKEKLHWKVIAKLKAAFDDSKIPFRVDVLDWNAIPENFKENIGKKFEVIQEAATKEGFRKIIEAQAVLLYDKNQIGSEQNPLYAPIFPSDWKPYSLHDLAEWINGMAFRNISFSKIGKPVIKIAEIKDGITGQTKFTEEEYGKVYLLTKGDMLFSWSGQPETSIDAFWYHGPDGWLNQQIFKVLPKNDCMKDFFYYLLKYLKPNFIRIARNKQTTGLGHVTKKDLQNIKVRIPEKNQQRAISHILGALDDKIELNRKMNQTLEEVARALYKSWFVDFDPVRKKVAGEPTGLPEEIDRLFPSEFDQSDLGKIPKGWKVGTVADFALLNSESWSEKTAPEKIRYIDLSNVKNGNVHEVEEYTFHDAPSRARWRLQLGDTIFGTVRPGNRSYALIYEDDLTGSTGFAVFRPKAMYMREIIYLVLTEDSVIESLAHLADGAAYPAVRPEVVMSAKCLNPGGDLLKKFSMTTANLLDSCGSNRIENTELQNIRDTLLPLLLSGKLPIKDAEEFLKKAGV